MPHVSSGRRSLVCMLGLAITFVLGCGARSGSVSSGGIDPTVVLVSIDGFRWDYQDRYDAPTLDALARTGTRAERLIPVFPTKTFPNHYSAVTGLYAGSHGILSNAMYDPRMDASFSLSSREAVQDPRWWGGEPIWVTAEKQGQKAATYFWPGSEAPIQGVRSTYWVEFDGSIPGEDRVDRVLEWLDLPRSDRPTFITLYFSDVDRAGHREGPDSPEVARAVERVDGYIARLVAGLESRDLLDRINLIVISDHGMAETSPERVVLIDRYFDPEEARIVDLSPVLMMYPPDDSQKESLDALKSDPHLQVYRKEELPDRFHLDHYRTPPIVAVAESGWVISTRDRYEQDPDRYRGGTHGYDNRSPAMGAYFLAHGPAFRKGYVAPPLEMVDLYEMMCSILKLQPAPNEGDPGAFENLLLSSPDSP